MRRVPLVKQRESADCGVAALQMIFLYYKKRVDINKLKQCVGTDCLGTTMRGLEKGAKLANFDTKVIKIKDGELKKGFTLPAIAHITLSNGGTHYVVVTKIKKNYVYYNDPIGKRRKIELKQFIMINDGVFMLLYPNNDQIDESLISNGNNKVYQLYFNLLKKQKMIVIQSIIISLIITGLGILFSFFNKYLMDEIIPYKLESTLLLYCITFLILYVLNHFLTFVRSVFLLYLSQKLDLDLVLDYFNHILRLPMSFFQIKRVGDIITRFTDSMTIKNILLEVTLGILIDIISLSIAMIILMNISTQLFFTICVIVLFNAILIYLFKKPYEYFNKKSMELNAKLNSTLIEAISNIETVKAHSYENIILEKIEDDFIPTLRLGFKQGMVSNVQAILAGLLNSIGSLIITYVGVNLIFKGNISIGTYLSFISLSSYFMSPIMRFIALQLQIQEVQIAAERMNELLQFEKEKNSEIMVDNIKELSLFNVSFRYGERKDILKNINLTIKQGEKIAIIGKNGSGKSTLLKLIMGLCINDNGEIKVNGLNMKDVDILNLRKHISYVPQKSELFTGTVKENLCMDNSSSLENIITICKKLGCDEFISRLPHRYSTVLTEQLNISSGEKQKIALARAIIYDSEVLLLDEATSNMDLKSEKEIFEVIFDLYRNKTVLVVSHRISSIKNFEKIIVLNNGEIEAIGNHKELLEKSNVYKDLVANGV